MAALLHWRTLVFVIPVAFAALLALGAVLGLLGDGAAEHHGGAGDTGHDGADDAGHDGADAALGQLPLTLRLMLLSFTFGGLGLTLGPAVWAKMPGAAGGLTAVTLAATGAVATSRLLSRLLVRRVPLFETETIHLVDLVGKAGRLVVSASTTTGAAQVRDAHGNLHQVSCRTDPGELPLPAGAQVLLVDYQEESRTFVVSPRPLG